MTTFYCLVRRSDGYIFYVGSSINVRQRLREHLCSKKIVGEYIRSLNKEIDLIEIATLQVNSWFEPMLEYYLISFFEDWGFSLLNQVKILKGPHKNYTHFNSFDEIVEKSAFPLVEKYFSK